MFDLVDKYQQHSEEFVWEWIMNMLDWGGREGMECVLDRDEFKIQCPIKDSWDVF